MYGYNSGRSYSSQLKPRQNEQPLDTVSSIVWDKDANSDSPSFVTGSWDGLLRVYQINRSGSQVSKVWEFFVEHPIICIDINIDRVVFAGLASGDVIAVQIATGGLIHMGTHESPVCGVFWIEQKKCLMTLGFDNLIKFWALQASNCFQKQYKLPLKTVCCSFDFPILLVGSIQTTLVLINIDDLPNLNIPNDANSYQKFAIQRFSKFTTCKINSGSNKGIMGTIDGRSLAFGINKGNNNSYYATQPLISRSQKKSDVRSEKFGQVNALDIGKYKYDSFTMIGGSQDLAAYNTVKKTKVKTLASLSTTTGATTAVKISPKVDFIAFATGTDWLKGLNQLQGIRKPKITVLKLVSGDLADFTAK